MNFRRFAKLLILVTMLAALGACSAGPAAAIDPATATPAPALTPEVGIAYPSTGGLPSVTPDYPAPLDNVTPTPLQQPKMITLEDSGKTVQLIVGNRFLLNLGADVYEWNLSIEDPSILGRVKNVMTIRGSQGLFEALKPGTTRLQADGNPLCANEKPACKMPSRLFTITVVVE